MSDEGLVKRLRDKWQHSEDDCYAAADAIERLTQERDEALRAIDLLVSATALAWACVDMPRRPGLRQDAAKKFSEALAAAALKETRDE